MKKIFTIIIVFVAAMIKSNAQGLVINEVDYDQPGTDSTEFIELYNSSSNAIDLSLYRVVLVNGNNNTPYDSITLPNQLLNPNSFFVICSSYGLVPFCDLSHTTPSGGFIQNGSPDAIAIRNTSTNAIVDAVSYEGNVVAPYIEGNGVPIGESDTATNASTLFRWTGISRFPDGADTGDDSTDFHRACSTPGAPNVNTSASCQQPTSVSPISARNQVAIYPNPTIGIVNVDLGDAQRKNATVSVSNLLGSEMKKVSIRNIESNYQLSISELPDGIYFIKVKSDIGETMKRIILKK